MPQEYGPQLSSPTCYVPGYGRVLLYDDVEGVLKWARVDVLEDGFAARRNDAAYQGDYGIRIAAYQASPNGWAWEYSGRSVGLRGHKHVRASVVFRSSGGIVAKGFRLWVRYYDGTYRWQGSHEYVFLTNDRGWHCLSLEMDFQRGVYVDGWLDGKDLGISGNVLSKVLNGSPEVLYVIMGVGSNQRRGLFANFDLVLVQEV